MLCSNSVGIVQMDFYNSWRLLKQESYLFLRNDMQMLYFRQ